MRSKRAARYILALIFTLLIGTAYADETANELCAYPDIRDKVLEGMRQRAEDHRASDLQLGGKFVGEYSKTSGVVVCSVRWKTNNQTGGVIYTIDTNNKEPNADIRNIVVDKPQPVDYDAICQRGLELFSHKMAAEHMQLLSKDFSGKPINGDDSKVFCIGGTMHYLTNFAALNAVVHKISFVVDVFPDGKLYVHDVDMR